MRSIRTWLTALFSGLLLTACGSAEGDGSGAGTPAGTLFVDTGTYLARLPVQEPLAWGASTELDVNAAATLAPDGTLYRARAVMSDPFTVATLNLQTLEATGELFEWPDTSLSQRLWNIAFAPGGQYAAAIISQTVNRELHVIEFNDSGPTTLFTGFGDAVGRDLVWLNESELAFSLDVSDQDAGEVEGYDGAIVALDASKLGAGAAPSLKALVGIVPEDWNNPDSVSSITVNSDATSLLYSLNGNLWVKDDPLQLGEPHRLTRGTGNHTGAVFAPDNRSIAFVDRVSEYASYLFVIPNQRGEPVDLDSDRTHQLNPSLAAQRLIAWLP